MSERTGYGRRKTPESLPDEDDFEPNPPQVFDMAPPPPRVSNVGAALARLKRELLHASLKYRRANAAPRPIEAWVRVIEKQVGDLKVATSREHIKKELAQIAVATLLALAAMEEGE